MTRCECKFDCITLNLNGNMGLWSNQVGGKKNRDMQRIQIYIRSYGMIQKIMFVCLFNIFLIVANSFTSCYWGFWWHTTPRIAHRWRKALFQRRREQCMASPANMWIVRLTLSSKVAIYLCCDNLPPSGRWDRILACSSQKPSSADISETESAILDPLV